MPMPFHPLTLDQFAALLARFPFRRRIDAVHMHHTWKPAHADYRGLDSIVGMWRYHTQHNGWSDIAQHVTIAPDGTIWTGRDWNRAPASAGGHNGSSAAGPFMFEMIGNFDAGRDRFGGRQREVVLEVIARVQQRFGLPLESLRFHRQMTDQKSCPGTGIRRDEVLAGVRRVRERLQAAAPAPARELPFAEEMLVSAAEEEQVIAPVLAALTRALPAATEPLEAEAEAEEAHGEAMAAPAVAPSFAVAPAFAAIDGRAGGVAEREAEREAELAPAELAALRPHLVNLTQGRLSAGGALQTTAGDVDAIFDEHMPRALREAGARGEPLRLLFYAHGGLVSEAAGLRLAALLAPWWVQNGVYPIYFVWETGLWETLGALLGGRRELALQETAAAARGLADVSDRVLEEVARRAGGGRLWGGMKYSAERAVGNDGGARYVAQRLADLCAAHPDAVELHAVGHSAGSIFHSYFVPTALALGTPAFHTLTLLAPAIRTDAFLDRLAPVLGEGRGVRQATLITLDRHHERADRCGPLYRKSLLYLVSNALEPRRAQPLLGLEESLRADRALQRLFGLAGAEGAAGEVVWAPTAAGAGRGASHATSHGGFDNDRATMESVLRRVLGLADEAPVVPFPAAAARAFSFSTLTGDEAASAGEMEAAPPADAVGPVPEAPMGESVPAPVEAPARPGAGRRARRRALCVGIDRYASAPLAGCVADARLWARHLSELGFETSLLLDEHAAKDGIVAALRAMLRESRAGDVLVFQYAGHGTHFRDAGGDEADREDEALVPFDYAAGRFLLDDEQHALFGELPPGVNLTCFYDCCHSGTMARAALDAVLQARHGIGATDVRARFIDPTPEMEAAYHAYRAEHPRPRAAERAPRAVAFAACRDTEVALEQSGQGLFTGHAARMLRDALHRRASHEQFQQRVVAAFGAQPPQHPQLDCAEALRRAPLLQPLAAAPAGTVLHLPTATVAKLLEEARQMDRAELPGLIDQLNEMLNGQ